MIAGLVYAWSAISPDLISSFGNVPDAKSSLVFTVCMIFFCIGGLIAGKLSSKISRKIILFSGIIFISLGLALSILVKNFNLLFLTYSLFCGMGAGIIYNVCLGIVVLIDEENVGKTSGILLMAYGLGAFVMGFVYKLLIEILPSFKHIYILLALIFGVLGSLSAFLIKLPKNENQTYSETNTEKNNIFKSFDFYIFFIFTILFSGIGFILISHANKIIISQINVDIIKYITVLSGLVAIANGAGRVLHGFILDKIDIKHSLFVAPLMLIITYALLSLTSAIKVNIVIAIMILILGGASFAGIPPMNAKFIKEAFGKEHYSFNFALINLNVLISSFFPVSFGKLIDLGLSYTKIYLIQFAISIVGILIAFVLSKRISKSYVK